MLNAFFYRLHMRNLIFESFRLLPSGTDDVKEVRIGFLSECPQDDVPCSVEKGELLRVRDLYGGSFHCKGAKTF